ncbi:SH3 domain-containing protein [Cypionkella aquatica]|nr:SH3 domain-containing protein [Cypionkella aquatica]
MFKLTLFLCAGLYAAMVFGGVDRGQQRFGMIAAVPVVAAPVMLSQTPEPAVLPVTQAAFVPDAPLMATPVSVQTTPEPVVAAAGLVMVIASTSANVRSGPGKDYDVVDRLTRGESVLVVAQGEGVDGWSLIRVEGDGIEGYIASRLLRE